MNFVKRIILPALLVATMLPLIALAQSTQTNRFITVEGADLIQRMSEARKKHQAMNAGGNFWTAYAFDVRPGIAVDPRIDDFSGSINTFGGVTVFTGKHHGMQIETRNLGIFALHEPNSSNITRLEIYNPEKTREHSGHPVYWLGRGGNEESLNYLRGIIEANSSPKLAENATVAIALHDDPRVGETLKNLVRTSSNGEVRRSAVHWLGTVGGQDAFLAELVRNGNERIDLRGAAGYGLGRSQEPGALTLLTKLYDGTANRELRKKLLYAISVAPHQEPAINFLINVAKNEGDRDTRQQALFWLGRKAGEKTLGVLRDAVESTDADTEVQKHAVYVISRRAKNEAVPILINIARTHPKPEVRKQALFWLGRSGDERAVALFEELLGK